MGEDRWIGRTIDKRYRIVRRIGSGGMGVVYEAEHVGLARRVAVKIMRTEHVEPTLLERFRREARLASRIVHPHIVQVFDIGNEDDIDFIAMELVEGRDLGAVVLAEGRLSIERAVAIVCQMLEALQVVHDAGIIHRDIKPANVLVAPGDDIKLMDFGIARGLDDTSLTRTGHIVGTTEFMSPEQFRGGAIDHRSDLYSVGITLFSLLAGELPFHGATAELAGAHVFVPPPSLAKLRPEIPRHIVAAVERALAKAPADRFADARAFAAALVAAPAVEPHTVAARPKASIPPILGAPVAAPIVIAPVVAPAPDVVRRRWLVPLIAGGVLVGILCALVIRSLGHHDAKVDTVAPVSEVRPAIAADPVADVAVGVARVSDAPSVASVASAPADAARASGAAALPRGEGSASPPELRRCSCIPIDAPDLTPLCQTKGPPKCRCDGRGRSLCEEPMKPRCFAEGLTDINTDVTAIKPGGDPCFTLAVECSYDPHVFARPGEVDAPCTGYPSPWWGAPGGVSVETGHTECDVCPGTNLRAFSGRPGDPCTGFYYRTGASRTGKLDFCH